MSFERMLANELYVLTLQVLSTHLLSSSVILSCAGPRTSVIAFSGDAFTRILMWSRLAKMNALPRVDPFSNLGWLGLQSVSPYYTNTIHIRTVGLGSFLFHYMALIFYCSTLSLSSSASLVVSRLHLIVSSRPPLRSLFFVDHITRIIITLCTPPYVFFRPPSSSSYVL